MYMLLDVNTEIYPLNIGERFLLVLSPSLVLNTKDMNSNNVCSRVDCWASPSPIPPPRLYKPQIITYEGMSHSKPRILDLLAMLCSILTVLETS
ncbi:unnamed protein product [Trifolium pratense]|uniref:Uncharacterized protein n=1 Tax=Trifolium pratense TaxID=57577 RepID=A0ACB0LA92_TRIPR|nr:unnamed protein product [Trifolium pratense]